MKKLLLFTFALFLWTGAWADKTVYLNPNKWYTGEGNEAFSVWVCDAADASTNPNQFVAMTPVDGTSYYQAVFSDAYTKIVFVRHSTSGPADWTDNKWNQTDDITTFADKSLFTITYWHSGSDSGNGNSSYSYNGDAHTLYSATFATGLDWTNVYAYAWNGSTHCIGEWPGKKMTATSETFTIDGVAETIYSISFLSTVTPSNILFNKGENGAIGVNQTADLTFTDDKFYFLPTANPIDPTDLAARVSVIFSDYYNRNLTDPNNDWGGGPNPKFSSIEYPVIKDGHKVVHVIGTAVNGRTTTQLNSQYSDFHVKLWPKTATKFKIWDDNKYSSATTYSGILIPGQWNDVTIEGVSFTTAYIGIELFDGDTPETEFFLDHFYFAKPPVVDNTPPTLSVCSLKSTNCVSATLTLQATDNLSETVYYKITNTANSTVWQTSGANGAEIEYVVGGLSADTEYNFSVVAMDENENSSNPQLINATTSDYPAIPVPDKKEADVKTLYGYYGSATGLNKTSGTDFEMLGKTVVKYKHNNAQFSLPADPEFDASDMDYIHFDILSDVDTPTALFVENRTENWKGKDVDGGLAAGEWTSFDVPVSFFITECGQTMTRVINLALIKAVSNKSGHDGFNDFSSPYPTLYIANAYLWKASEDIDPSTIKSVTVTAASTSIAEGKTTQLTVTDQSSRDVTSLMTFGSSNTGVATVDENGLVTAINPGTARITATVTGYGESSYIDITVTEAPLGFDLTEGNHTIHVTPYHYVGTNNYKLVITSEETMTGMGGSFWFVNGVAQDMRKNEGTSHFDLSGDGKTITISVESTSAPQLDNNIYILCPGEVNFGKHTFPWIEAQKVSIISAAEWASFSSSNALDFGKVEGLKAYYATANDGLNISYNTVEKAPAGTGLILGGEQGNYDVPVIDAAPALSSTNLLQSTAAGAYTILAEDANMVYVFGKIGSDIGFVKGEVGYVIGANKAYLRLTNELAAKGFNFIGLPGSETDGINKVNTLVETGVRYNLAGQRVGNDYKGIVIVNGRKVVIK